MAYTLLDRADAERFPGPYRLAVKLYAAICGGSTTKLLHRLIASEPEGMEVDHVNCDKLDNRRCNLRVCTHAENQQNRTTGYGSSRHRGVSFYKPNGKWRAYLAQKTGFVSLGYFDSEEDAAVVASAARSRAMPFSNEERLGL